MATEKMNIDERFKYLRMMQERYDKVGRDNKAVAGRHACATQQRPDEVKYLQV